MLLALLVMAGIFCALLLLRVSGAQRAELVRRWPAVLLALAAIVMLIRGAFLPGLVLAGASVGLWFLSPTLLTPKRNRSAESAPDPADEEARRLLGLNASASDADIRAAYRTKMAQAHPDRGGSHAAAAKLTAARDRLLRKRR